MSTATLVYEVRRVLTWGRCADYLELTKPRIALLVLMTVAAGGYLASSGAPAPVLLVAALAGTALVAASASVFNHLLERRSDARMQRTSRRPLPSGRVAPWEAAVFGSAMLVAGLWLLAWQVNDLTAWLGAASWALYVLVYTPLKTRTNLNTFVGAVPGALPVVMGWTAFGGRLDAQAWSLFAIVFFWQFPHFLAIAWLYRHDYAAAGLKMLPADAPRSRATGWTACAYALVLVPVSLWPTWLGLSGWGYAILALLLSGAFLGSTFNFARHTNETTARSLLRASLLYLPSVFVLLLVDHWLR